MRAYCPSCDLEMYWYAGRGNKLADVRCGQCGGKVRSRKDPLPIRPRGAKVKCAICGKLRQSGGMRVRAVKDGEVFRLKKYLNAPAFDDVTFRPGTLICYFHNPLPDYVSTYWCGDQWKECPGLVRVVHTEAR